MPWGFDHCHQEGCTRPRKRGTVFCEQHHEEQLRRPPPSPRPPSPPTPQDTNPLRSQCARILRHHKNGFIDKEEVLGQLYDLFISFSVQRGGGECWGAALDSLPEAVMAELLAYVQTHRPRLFGGVTNPQVRAMQASAAPVAQAELIARIREKSR